MLDVYLTVDAVHLPNLGPSMTEKSGMGPRSDANWPNVVCIVCINLEIIQYAGHADNFLFSKDVLPPR